ncbi:phage holin family protein [Halovulum sp. GXIMD14794]
MSGDARGSASTAGLLSDLLGHVHGMVRNEVNLARAEISESVNRATGSAVMLIVAAVIGLTALDVLAGAAVAGLAEATELGAGWSALIVGGVLALVALILVLRGRSNLKFSNLAPKRTVRNVRRDANTVKEIYNAE